MADQEPRVTLRPVTDQDARDIASWSRDEDFCRAAEWSLGLPVEEHVSFQRDLAANPGDELVRLAVVHGDEAVGYVDLQGADPVRRELGYVVGPSAAWGRGFGTAAARAGLAYGFDVLGLEEIWAEALDANHASVRILQRVGMTETGRGANDEFLGQPTHYRQFTPRRPSR